jgi:hypothetical protein
MSGNDGGGNAGDSNTNGFTIVSENKSLRFHASDYEKISLLYGVYLCSMWISTDILQMKGRVRDFRA